MTTSDKLREIAVKWCPWSEKTSFKRNGKDYVPFNQMVSDLTALISEGYVEKSKYDELLRQRDELKEAFNQMRQYWSLIDSEADAEQIAGSLWEVLAIAEAAIKNTEG